MRIVAASAATVALLLAGGCGSSDTEAGAASPEDAVSTLMSGLEDGSCARVRDVVVTPADVVLERPRNRDHGDWTTNVAMKFAKRVGASPRDLATEIANQIGCELGETTLKTFASGETYCRYEDSIRGADIFIVQTASMPVDQHLMELLIMINAAAVTTRAPCLKPLDTALCAVLP